MSHLPFIAIDFETAGYYSHSACAIGLARVENRKIVDEYYSLIKPPSRHIKFTHIHGLTWKVLRDAPGFAKVWSECAEFISGASFFVAHNATFDKKVLLACCNVFEQPWPGLPFFCTLKGSRKALPLEAFNLHAVCDYFGYELDHHNAASDARYCGLIFTRLVKMGVDQDCMLCK